MKISLKHLVIVVVLLIVAIFFLWPNEEKVIRKRLNSLAEDICKSGSEADLIAAGVAMKIGGYFTPATVISVGAPVPDIKGQQDVKRAAILGRASVSSIWVKFVDVSMVFEGKSSVLVECTAQGRIEDLGNEQGYQARYLEIRMVKESGEWLIAEMKEVKALQ